MRLAGTANRRRTPVVPWALLAGLAVASPLATFAQPTTGGLQGRVLDSSGGAVAGVDIVLSAADAASAATGRSDATGAFTFPLVPPGTYWVEASLPGFRATKVEGVRIQVAGTTAVDIVLQPGEVRDFVTVTAGARIDRTSTAVSTNVDARFIQDLPNFNRHVLEMAHLAPGVAVLATSGQVIGIEGASVIANGLRRTQNTYYLDGAENSSAWRNVALQFPNPDTVQEVQVQSSNASGQFGRQPGAVVSVITRSGTNTFKGSVSHFFHDERLNANAWSNNRNGLPKWEDGQRYTSGVVGGPIVHDRTFFFGSVNRYANNLSKTQQGGRFPTAAMKAGDFAEVPDFIGRDGQVVPFSIKDPATGAVLGTRIPASLFDAAALRLLERLPTAAAYYDVAVRQFEQPVQNMEYLLKVDQHVSVNHRLSGLLLLTDGHERDPGQSWSVNQTPAWGDMLRTGRQTSLFLKHTWVASANFQLETRASSVGSESDADLSDGDGLDDVGIVFPFQPKVQRLPTIRLDSQGGFRADHVPLDFIGQRNFRVGTTGVWNRGSHMVTVGGDAQVDEVQFEVNRDLRTIFNFSGRDSLNGPITSASTVPLSPGNLGVQNFAYAWADFLMGRVDWFYTSGYNRTRSRTRSLSAFVQDQWRVSSQVTASLGLRYDLGFPTKELTGGSGGAFVQGHRSSRFPMAPEHLAWPGDVGVPSDFIGTDANNVAPQVGVAWDVRGDGRHMLRAGAGLYYAPVALGGRIFTGPSGFGGAWPGGANALLRDPFGTSRVNPFDVVPQYGPGNPVPDAVTGYTPVTFPWESQFQTVIVRGVPTRVFTGSIVGYDPQITTPSVAEFNVVYERVLTRGWTAAAGYVGNRGRHQPVWQAFNAAVPMEGADTSSQSLRDRRPFPTLGGGRIYGTVLNSTYDSLQTWTDVRARGVTARASYVLARALSPFGANAQSVNWTTIDGFSSGSASGETIMDSSSVSGQSSYPYDRDRDWGENGRRHTFKLHASYAPAFDGGTGWTSRFATGWTLSGAFVATSGLPLNILWGMDANADGVGLDRPTAVGAMHYARTPVANAPYDRRGAIQYLDPAGFTGPCNTLERTGPAAYCTSVGDVPRNAARGVPLFNLDLALAKVVPVHGSMRGEIRLEVFNVTNSNFLGTPELNLASPYFGQVTSRLHRPRNMQVGLRFLF